MFRVFSAIFQGFRRVSTGLERGKESFLGFYLNTKDWKIRAFRLSRASQHEIALIEALFRPIADHQQGEVGEEKRAFVSQTCLGANVPLGLVTSTFFRSNFWAFLGPCVRGRGAPLVRYLYTT